MPKSTTEKNTKGTKKNVAVSKKTTTKKTPAKKAAVKKATTKKVVAKKTPAKKVEVKKEVVKKAPTKKVEVKKEVAKKVEVKETPKKENIKKGKNKLFQKVDELVVKAKTDTAFLVTLCIIVVLIAALIFTLCIKKVSRTSDGKQILASVNGKTITSDDLFEELKEKYATDSLINIIDEYIADKEVTVTDKDKEYVQQVVDYYKEYADYYGTDLSTFLAQYAGISGVTTEKEFYNYVLKDYKKTLAVEKFIGDNAKEEDLKQYYKDNYTDKLTVKHILIEVDQDAEDKDKADKEAYNKAKDLINELNKTSAKKLDSKFEKLAEDNSDDTATYSNGGLIEEFAKKDVEEEFWNASYKLKDGKYTKEPVKTSYGYHIILRVSSTPVEKYKDVKDDVKKAYAESLLSTDTTLAAKKWDELRKQYKLKFQDDNVKKAYKKAVKDATKKVEEAKGEEKAEE